MIPILHEVREIHGLSIWRTTDNRIGFASSITPCDIEAGEPNSYYQKLVQILRNIDNRILLRITNHEEEQQTELSLTSRSNSFNELSYLTRSTVLSVEVLNEPAIITKVKSLIKGSEFDNRTNLLLDAWNLLKQSGIQFTPFDTEETKMLFLNPDNVWIKNKTSISNGSELVGIIRQVRPGNFPISFETLPKVLAKLPKPFFVHISFRRLNFVRVRLDLEKKLKQSEAATTSIKGQLIQDSALKAIEQSIKDGSQFLEYEFLITFNRTDEAILLSDIKKSLSHLGELGDFSAETFGVAPGFLATLPGNSQHVTLMETDQVLPLLLPIWVSGEAKNPQLTKSSFLTQRFDGTLSSFNLFDSEFNVANTLIIGTSGKGKSVLTGLLTQSILNDPNIQVIKIDVGGSHSKECELFGGTEHILTLDKSSGINPISYLQNSEISKPEKINIISKFLSILIQEQGETQLKKDIREQIETSLSEYIDNAKEYTLQEFFDTQTNFPRRNLLKRWVNGGVYENAFKSNVDTASQEKKLRYYNFSQVFQASDPDFAQAGMASVLAQFNFETLLNRNKRIVLICDETPFFVKSCFDFFKFSTANVRKYGHAVILISQLSTDLIVGDDTGIIENSPQRFLFSVDGSKVDFAQRFNINEALMDKISNLKTASGKYSEVILSTPNWHKSLRLRITPKEYWTHTSSKQDKIKMEKLLEAVPGLTLKEAIACLSV